MCVEHSVIAEGSDCEDAEPTQWRWRLPVLRQRIAPARPYAPDSVNFSRICREDITAGTLKDDLAKNLASKWTTLLWMLALRIDGKWRLISSFA